MRRLLVVRLGSLGDLVHTLPAVDALTHAEPPWEVDWLVDAVHADFLRLVPAISRVVVLASPSPAGWMAVRRELRARDYDVAADFQGLVKSAALARLSGARRVVGFDRSSLREPAARFLCTETIDVRGAGHVVHKNLRLARALGGRGGETLTFPLAPVESAAFDALSAHVSSPFALINPGAAWPNKRWPPERFGQLSRHLHDRHALPSVVLWGPGESALAAAVVAASDGAAVAAPETALPDLVALARHARIIVSGDTGPVHIAAAVGVPVVALFGPTDPDRNGPWDRADVSLSRYATCECHYKRRCDRRDGWCLGDIGLADVVAAVDARLASVDRVRP